MKMSFYDKISHLAIQNNKSINQIEKELGFPRNSLHNYKLNSVPSGIRLIEISHYFNVAPEFLLGKISSKNRSVNAIFNSLNDDEKKEILCLCCEWLSSTK